MGYMCSVRVCICSGWKGNGRIVCSAPFPLRQSLSLHREVGWRPAKGNLVILLSLLQGYGYRSKQLHVAFDVSSVDSNSVPHACTASTPTL